MGGCVNSKNIAVYQKYTNQAFEIIKQLEISGEKSYKSQQKNSKNFNLQDLQEIFKQKNKLIRSYQVINLDQNNADSMSQELKKLIPEINTHIIKYAKSLREHLADNQNRLTNTVTYIIQKIYNYEGDIYYLYVGIFLLDYLSQNINQFIKHFKTNLNYEDEGSQKNLDAHNSSIGPASQNQSTVKNQDELEQVFLSDNFIQFEELYLYMLEIAFQNPIIQFLALASINQYSQNMLTIFYSERIYNILRILNNLLKNSFLSLYPNSEEELFYSQQQINNINNNNSGIEDKNNNSYIKNQKNQSINFDQQQKLQEEFYKTIETYKQILIKLPFDPNYFNFISNREIEIILETMIHIKKYQINKQKKLSNNNQENAEKNDKQIQKYQEKIQKICLEVLGVISKRALYQNNYQKVVHPLLLLFDQFKWSQYLDIEKILKLTLDISKKQQVQLNYESYLIDKILDYISFEYNYKNQQENKEKTEFQYNQQPDIKIRALKVLQSVLLLRQDSQIYHILQFQIEKIFQVLLELLIGENPQHNNPASLLSSSFQRKNNFQYLHQNPNLVEEVQNTFLAFINLVPQYQKSSMQIILQLTNFVYQFIQEEKQNIQPHMIEQMSKILNLTSQAIQKLAQRQEQDAIKEEIILNLLEIAEIPQLRNESYKILEQIITVKINTNNFNNNNDHFESIFSPAHNNQKPNNIISNKYHNVNINNNNDSNNLQANVVSKPKINYYLIYDNCLAFIFVKFIKMLINFDIQNLNQNQNQAKMQPQDLTKIGWNIMRIISNISNRQDAYNQRHLQFLVISVGILLINNFEKFDNIDEKQQLAYILITRIIHSKVVDQYLNKNGTKNIEYEQEVENQNLPAIPVKQQFNYQIGDDEIKIANVFQKFQQNQPPITFKNFQTQILNERFDNKKKDIMNQIKEEFNSIDQHNTSFINYQQLQQYQDNFDQKYRAWQEKIKGIDNLEEINNEQNNNNNYYYENSNQQQQPIQLVSNGVNNSSHKNDHLQQQQFAHKQSARGLKKLRSNQNNTLEKNQIDLEEDNSFQDVYNLIQAGKQKKKQIELNDINLEA
ncbi:hypothetical protein PPERSA_08362 [Pseudocohnilembus persalinus]|uniref:Uncharacterized protein n=1 Tax=Pseudocohnilembus persalinus TaxID=266149 RepID=A0A0V0QMF4_PSEPJ|nr:hypothetical protein PPERSA_08362 [Pseudocohnilembus persalinus]|eukprot:KRX03308.1 hypothetical protein PPERSA_08362 [Pseudocohnilembus persalinus]